MNSFPTLITLLRKDLRVYRPALVSAALLAPAPALFAWASAAARDVDLGTMLLTLDNASQLALVVAAAMFGGYTFAAERRDGSSEFLAALPPAKGSILLSKLLVSACSMFCFMCLLYTCGQVIVWLDGSADPRHRLFGGSIWESLREWAGGLVPLTFAIGLLFSSCAKGPAIASTGAVVGTILLLTLAEALVRPMLVVVSAPMRSSPELRGAVFRAMPGALAVLILALTLLQYTRRKTV